MKIFQKYVKGITGVGLACMMAMGNTELMAASSAEIINGIYNFKAGKEWEDADEAPTLKLEITDAYKRKGEQEIFTIELNNANWYEGMNTTLFISEAEGIYVYDGYVSPTTKSKAEVVINIPSNIGENEKIIIEIPLLIKVLGGKEEVSLEVKKGDSSSLIDPITLDVATTSEKKMTWKIGQVPTIGEGESIAPIIFTETRAGALGTREMDVHLYIKNSGFKFKEPEYISKTENADDIDYKLDADQYVEYSGGFEKDSGVLKVSINKDGRAMRVVLKGSAPNKKGIITIKNLPIEVTQEDSLNQNIKIKIQSDEITNSNQEIVVAHYDCKKTSEEVDKEVTQENNTSNIEELVTEEADKIDSTNTTTSTNLDKTIVKFKVNTSSYMINDVSYPMQGTTFIKDPGYTMVPVRYVAEALGAKNMQYKDGIVTFTYNEKNIILSVGSKEAYVNQTKKIMELPLELVEGRVYAPIGEIANLLGVQKSWDAQSQSAYFSK